MVNHATYHLEPGYIFASVDGAVIRTVVGSCVAVCLWDDIRVSGGMNHFLYPEIKDKSKMTAQYGNVAIPALIRMMKKIGCSKRNLVAQVYGGGQLYDSKRNCVGQENAEVARQILRKNNIPIISEDVGGKMGRKILFDTCSGHVAVLKVHRLRQEDWIENRN
jgi:chemotaxis protein CheD